MDQERRQREWTKREDQERRLIKCTKNIFSKITEFLLQPEYGYPYEGTNSLQNTKKAWIKKVSSPYNHQKQKQQQQQQQKQKTYIIKKDY